MADQSVQQQLQAQLAEQLEAIESLAVLLAAEANPELQQLHDELNAGYKETQLALDDLQSSTNVSNDPATPDLATASLEAPGQQHALQPVNQLCRLRPNGLYERAELLSVQPGHSAALIALHSTGAQHRLASEQLVQSVTIQQHTALSDSGGSDAHSQSEASSDFNSQDEEDAVAQSRVRGHVASAVWDADEAAMQAASAGPQTDTAHFASWEGSTRGIGSKLMAGMGYVQGQGLGTTRPGTLTPLEVRLYKQGAGLGASAGMPAEGSRDTKKRKRGGERSRKKKFAEQARHNKQQHRDAQHKHELDTGDAGLFSLINSKLGDKPHGQEASQQQRHEEAGPHTATHTSARPSRFVDASQKVPAAKLQDRRELILQREKLEGLRQQVARLQAMAARNSKDKVMLAQIGQKLQKAKAAVATAERATAGHESALTEQERQKKWIKF